MCPNLKARLVDQSCQEIMNCVSNSSLNFSMQITPFSIYITLRKSFSKNRASADRETDLRGDVCYRSSQGELQEQIEHLSIELKQVKTENQNLKLNNEETIEDCEASHEEIKLLKAKLSEYRQETTLKQEALIKQLRHENSELLEQVNKFEKESKHFKKVGTEKEKEIHDLNKDTKIQESNFKQLKAKFDEMSAAVNREKKQQERKIKKKDAKDFLNNMKAESVNVYFDCEVCDVKTETKSQLMYHVRSFHMKSIQSQTDYEEEDKIVQVNLKDFTVDKDVQTEDDKTNETFVKYPCKYCGTNIANPYHLFEHVERCRGTFNFCTEPGLPVIKFFPPSFNLHPPPPPLHNPYSF